MSQLFLGYAHADAPWVKHLRTALTMRGFDLWIDRENMEASKLWLPRIEQAIVQCEISCSAVAAFRSAFELRRARTMVARQHGKPIPPIRRQASRMAKLLSGRTNNSMIDGAHVLIYTKDAEADRAFFRDILEFASVNAGHGWLIFRLPAAEAAFHPAEENDRHQLYLMCDDLKNEMDSLRAKGVECTEVVKERWGSITKIRLPGGGQIGLYEPKHSRPKAAIKTQSPAK